MGQPLEQPKLGFGDSIERIFMVANLWSTGFTVPIRRRFGREYPGYGGIVAFVGIPVFAAMTESQFVLLWWQFWIVMLACRRIGMFIREWRGDYEESPYQGESFILEKLPYTNEHRAKGLEPLCYGAASYFVPDPGLSMFFLSGAVSLWIVHLIHSQLRYKEWLSARDAQIAGERQERLMRGYRN